MFELLYWYSILALSGAIFSLFSHYIRVRGMLKESGNYNHPFVANPIISAFVWMGAVVFFFPLVIRPLLFDSYRERFITQTYTTSIAD